MNRTPAALAWWHFGLGSTSGSWRDADARDTSATLAALALETLDRHELLKADRLEVVLAAPAGVRHPETDHEPEEPPIDVPVEDTDIRALQTILDRAGRYGGRPRRVRFHGTGVVYDADATPHRVVDPVVLTVSMDVDLAFQVSTDLDVWLPYDVYGEPQRSVADHNRPRLRAALEELSALGLSVSNSEATRYAVVDGLHVRNHTNAFGQPVAVL